MMPYNGYPLTNHDTIVKSLTYLTNNQNDITHLSISKAYITDKIASMLATFLASDNCVVTNLDLSHNSLSLLDNAKCIADAMAKNKSIVYLDLRYNAARIGMNMRSLDEFISHLAKCIKNHPCIRMLDISSCTVHESLPVLADYMPKSLVSLKLCDNWNMDRQGFEYFMEHCRLKEIDLLGAGMEVGYIFNGIERSILANTSILKLNYTWYHSRCTVQKNEEVKADIELMLLLNRKARRAARDSALALIAIRKFRVRESGLLGWVPKELVLMMAKCINASYGDVEWRLAVATPNKKIRL